MIFGNEFFGNCFRILRLEWRIRELKKQLKKSQRELHGIMKVAMELDLFIKKNERA